MKYINLPNMKHYFKHLFLCACLFTGISAFAADEINDVYYNLSDSTAEVTAVPNSGTYKGDIVIPESFTYDGVTYTVTGIADNAFSGCKSLTSVSIPASVTTIGKNAFSGCERLSAITLPANLTTIGEKAFFDCKAIPAIAIPASVTSIGSNAFADCASLASISVASGNTTYSSPSNCNAIVQNATNLLILGCKNTVIPASVTSIGSGAFAGSSELTAITIPSNVTKIAKDAFTDCTGLTAVTLESATLVSAPKTTETSMKSFFGTQVETYTIANGITSIGAYVFYGCKSATAINIPSSVTSFGNNAFSGCKSLTAITIPNGITSIPDYTFYGCNSLTSINIPTTVTEIGRDAFNLCRSLTSVTIPTGVTKIKDFTFYGCNDLTSVTIPEGVDTIGRDAFAFCNSLASIKLPSTVKSIGDYLFYNCTSLASVNIPNGVTEIKDYTFGYCLALNSVNFPSSVTKISTNALYESGWYDNQEDGVLYLGTMAYGYKGDMQEVSVVTLYYGKKLTVHYNSSGGIVELNPGTKTINESAFSGYNDLTFVVIPESLDTISSTAFAGCLGLSHVFSYAVHPPQAAPDAFGSLTGSYTRVVVYDEAVEAYKAHSVWGKFQVMGITEYESTLKPITDANIFGSNDPDGIRSTNSDAWASEVYDLSGRRQNAPQRGMNIIRMSDGTTRKVMVK